MHPHLICVSRTAIVCPNPQRAPSGIPIRATANPRPDPESFIVSYRAPRTTRQMLDDSARPERPGSMSRFPYPPNALTTDPKGREFKVNEKDDENQGTPLAPKRRIHKPSRTEANASAVPYSCKEGKTSRNDPTPPFSVERVNRPRYSQAGEIVPQNKQTHLCAPQPAQLIFPDSQTVTENTCEQIAQPAHSRSICRGIVSIFFSRVEKTSS